MIIWEKEDEDGEICVEFGAAHTHGEVYVREAIFPHQRASVRVRRDEICALRNALTTWLEEADDHHTDSTP